MVVTKSDRWVFFRALRFPPTVRPSYSNIFMIGSNFMGAYVCCLCTQTLDKGYHVLEDFYLFKYFIYFTHFFFQIFIVICSFVIMRVRFSALNQETHVWIGRVVKSGVNVFWFLFEKHMAVFKSSVIVGLSVLPPFYRLTFYGYSACKSHFDLLLSRFTQP